MGFHAVILGGGPAGCGAAITLARAGVRVTLLERERFPRVKVCGECISPAASGVLEGLIPAARLEELGARRVGTYVLEFEDREAVWETPRKTWTLSRSLLDTELLGLAREAGVEIRQPTTARSVEYDAGGVRVMLDDRAVDGDLVIHADGSGRHDPAGATPNRAGVVGCKCHLRMPYPLRGVHMRAAGGGGGAYIGLVSVEDGLVTCAFTVRAAVLAKFGGDHDAALMALWPGYRKAWREMAGEMGAWRSCGVAGSGYIEPGHEHSWRVGNAAAAVEPIGGEGIGLALWAGVRAGELIAGGMHRARFAEEYRAKLRWRRPVCRGAAEVLMRPAMVRALWPIFRRPGVALGPWWALSGKVA